MTSFPAPQSPHDRWALRLLRILWFAGSALLAMPSPAREKDPTNAGIPARLPSVLGYSVDHWSSEDGHPLRNGWSVAQTPDGYVWVGTPTGLCRFDGTNFTVFRGEDIPALENARAMDLFCDSKGRLWIGGSESHAAIFKDNAFVRVAVEGGGNSNPCRWRFSESPEGDLWVYVQIEKGPHWFGRFEDGVIKKHDLAPPGRIDHFAADHDGVRWMVSGDRKSLLKRGGEGTETFDPRAAEGLRERTFGHFFKRRDGSLAVTGGGGIFSVGEEEVHLLRPLPSHLGSNEIFGSLEDDSGNFWTTTRGGLYLSRGEGLLERILLPEQHDLTVFTAMVEGQRGGLWTVGNHSLYRIRPSLFRSWGEGQGIAGGRVISVVEDEWERVWITTGRGLYQIGQDGAEPAAPSLANGKFWLAAKSAGGAVLVCRWERGIKSNSWHIEKWRDSVLSPVASGHGDVNSFIEAPAGVLWVGTGHGLLCFSEGKELPLPAEMEPDALIEDFAIDGQGRVIAAVAGRGLMRLEGEQWQPLTSASDRGSQVIEAIAIDGDGSIWAGGLGEGLAVWRDGIWRSFADLPGLPTQLGALALDSYDGLWMKTGRGLARVSRSALLAPVGPDSASCTFFDRSDGLISNTITGHQTGLFLDSQDRLWVSTLLGVSVIETNTWQRKFRQKIVPPVRIERILVDGNSVGGRDLPNGEELALDPGWHQLAFHYTSINPEGTQPDRFRYRMLGHDDRWVEAGENRSAIYSNLPPGKYRFELAIDEGDPHQGGGEMGIDLILKPHWWERVEASVGAVVIVILGVVLFVFWRFRVFARRQARQERFARELISVQEGERKRVAAELHDGLGQDLLLINNGIEEVMGRAGGEEKWRGVIGSVKEIVEQAVGDVRDLSHNLHPFKLERLGLSKTLRAIARQASEVSGLNISAEVDDIDGLFSDETEINIYRIIQEGMNNAIKHSHAANIKVVAKKGGSALIVEISDNGCGFNVATIRGRSDAGRSGFGLTGMEERARIAGGRIRYNSVPGQGTCLRLEVPFPLQHSQRSVS